jgi:hypothetical protein
VGVSEKTIKCEGCGCTETFKVAMSEVTKFNCDKCGARMVYQNYEKGF